MNLARASAVVCLISTSFPLIVACGSASDNLFSASSASSSTSHAGAAPGNGTAGADKGSAGSAGRGAGDAGGANGESNGGLGTTAAGVGGALVSGAGSVGAGSVGVGGALAGASSAGGPSAGAGNTGGGHAFAGTTGSADAGSGGTSGVSGTNAGADGGGTAGTSSCPVNAPSDNTPCLASTLDNCFYSGTACSCLPSNSGNPNSLRWSCFGTPNRCPEQKPEAGLSCNQNSDAACPYPGGDFCACPVRDNGQSTWACQPPQPTCSLAQPDEGAPCATVRSCSYGAVACFCNGSDWSCQGG
jgi:hypothetical protein